MITNGTLIGKYAEKLIDSGLDEIIFSLDGSEKSHDSIRGIQGTFKKGSIGISKLNDLKLKKGIKKPLININSTIFEQNYAAFLETLEAAKNFYPDNFTFHHLLFLKEETVDTFKTFFNQKFGQIPYDWQGFAVNSLPDIDPNIIIHQIGIIKEKNTISMLVFTPILIITI